MQLLRSLHFGAYIIFTREEGSKFEAYPFDTIEDAKLEYGEFKKTGKIYNRSAFNKQGEEEYIKVASCTLCEVHDAHLSVPDEYDLGANDVFHIEDEEE